ncbi:PIN domain-containing protein [Marinimicrobium sp. C6131]|uniref:PIN domain-containing protein n=1 Tax=unclassified Marinimicrobium TaxID=2632100 RepID=UPI00223E668B|nr:type II toxin-antitoxin system VapC family toxin [Marinimicrobium sp. C6131]UZJ45428.1 type II toxin-antitoxin system VapC family toxin [Marinimicrobium sp. C6131]
MIAIDTNVLLRYLLQDDKTQSQKAASLITGSVPVLVTDVVLVEAMWVLAGKRYGLNREAIAGVLSALFEEPNIVFEDGQTVWRALSDYKNARPVKVGGKKKSADFPDALIVNKAMRQAREWHQALEGVYTFDVAALEIPGTLSP